MINLGFMGFPMYEISIHGKVFNIKTHTEVKPQLESTGYMRVKLYNNGEYKRFRVHVLMAKAFMNPEYAPFVVNHIDGDKHNNDLRNLEIIDQKANTHHACANGRRVSLKGRKVWVACGFQHDAFGIFARYEDARRFADDNAPCSIWKETVR